MHEVQISVAHCASCQFTNADLGLVTCPRCGEVLGETVVTRRRGSWLPVALHWVAVAAILATVLAMVTR